MSLKMKQSIFPIAFMLLLNSTMTLAQEAKTVVDYHTTVEQMFHLQTGMTLSEVNETLNSEPHDLLQNTAGGYLMLEYRYLKSYRKVKTSEADTESGRIVGSPHYADAASVYLLFGNDNRLVSYVTSDALGDIEHQYNLERTAQRLGALDAPCAQECQMVLPGQKGSEAADMAVSVEMVIVEEDDEGVFEGLLGGVRDKIASIGNGEEKPGQAAELVEPETVAFDAILVGDAVWVVGPEGRSSGVVIDELPSGLYMVRYVDLMSGDEVDRQLDRKVLVAQD